MVEDEVMSEFKGTQGSWAVLPFENRLSVAAYKAHPVVICRIENTVSGRPIDDEDIANAQLIAAAPELLDALQSLKCELILSDVDMGYIESHFRPSLNKATAAIAKALGQ